MQIARQLTIHRLTGFRLGAALASVITIVGCGRSMISPIGGQHSRTIANGDNQRDAGGHLHSTQMKFKTQPGQVVAGQSAIWLLKILDAKAQPVKEFEIVHDKLLHLVVVSKDLSWFNHLYPEYKDNGAFIASATLPRPGDYKLYAAYTPRDGVAEVAQQELRVGGGGGGGGGGSSASTAASAPALAADKPQGAWMIKRVAATPEGQPDAMSGPAYEVALMPLKPVARQDVTLRFQVRASNGQPVADLESYLGAPGYCVIVSGDTNIYVPAQPLGAALASAGNGGIGMRATPRGSPTLGKGDVLFHARFPQAGLYKVWGQFQDKGQVITAPFVLNVAAGSADTVKALRPHGA